MKFIGDAVYGKWILVKVIFNTVIDYGQTQTVFIPVQSVGQETVDKWSRIIVVGPAVFIIRVPGNTGGP